MAKTSKTKTVVAPTNKGNGKNGKAVAAPVATYRTAPKAAAPVAAKPAPKAAAFKPAPRVASPTATSRPAPKSAAPRIDESKLQSQIAQRAFELSQLRGGQPGHELEDWLMAEKEVKTTQARR